MLGIVRSLSDRFEALFITHAVLELEADLIAASAERKADLLHRADQYEKDGLASVAQELRTRADALSAEKPLDNVAAAIAHLHGEADKPSIQAPAPEPTKKKRRAS